MSATLREPVTIEEFLAWEERQELKYEFDGFGPVAVAGGTFAHAAIQRNLAIAVGGRLLSKSCDFVGSDFKIEVSGSVRYPDGMVVCTPVPRDAKLIDDPVVIFEVLCPSTAGKDRILKNREYRATPSVRRYVFLEQDRIAATVFTREGDDWIGRLFGDGDALAMPEIGITLPLAELYADLDLSQPPTEDD